MSAGNEVGEMSLEPFSEAMRMPGRAPTCHAWLAGMTHATQASFPQGRSSRPSSPEPWSAYQASPTAVTYVSKMDEAPSSGPLGDQTPSGDAESAFSARVQTLEKLEEPTNLVSALRQQREVLQGPVHVCLGENGRIQRST